MLLFYELRQAVSYSIHVSEITLHVCLCIEAMKVASEGKPPIKLETEVRCYGFASVMSAQYQGCYDI